MSLPRKLKRFNVFNNGGSFVTECKTVTLPKLGRKMEDYRGGGMSGPVKIDLGHEIIEFEHEYGGQVPALKRQFGATTIDAIGLRFVGAYQNDATGAVDQIEIVVRGRHEEIESGEQKVGEDGSMKVKTTCSYYRETVNGADIIEIDVLAGVEIYDGVDTTAALNAAINS